jgi:uncharacterized membrane protein HdeD (DUF308 family)
MLWQRAMATMRAFLDPLEMTLKMPDLPESSAELHEATRMWWLPLATGLLSVIAGVIVLAKPGDSLATIAVILGIFVAVDGIVALVSSLRRGTENRGLAALVGVLSLVVGVILIRHPIAGVTAVALLIGIWLIVVGAIRFVLAFAEDERRFWHALVALIELIAGIVIVSSPGIGLATLALLVGIGLIVNGTSLVVLGFVLHGARHDQPSATQRPAAAV